MNENVAGRDRAALECLTFPCEAGGQYRRWPCGCWVVTCELEHVHGVSVCGEHWKIALGVLTERGSQGDLWGTGRRESDDRAERFPPFEENDSLPNA